MTENTGPDDGASGQARLIGALARMLREGGRAVEVFETHISTIVVAPPDAYKFKKPLRFDFLDFSTPEARRFYCEEEVRLNRRLAPQLYLGVAAVGGTPARPTIAPEAGAPGAALEHAVWMRAFPQQALWSERIARGQLGVDEIDQLALRLAQFHAAAARAPADSPWGGLDTLRKTGADTLDQLDALARAAPDRRALARLRRWQDASLDALAGRIARRKADGWVRECHGDLHSGNILTLDGRVTPFDCIEFNPGLRWIDVVGDLAFICMDLRFHDLERLGARLLDGYLEAGGDYAGVALLRHHQCALALVRWKIAALRALQLEAGPALAACAAQAARYRDLALRLIRPTGGAIILMHGYSGSGKSFVARALVELLGALRIRSDVERKRIHGVAADAGAPAPESESAPRRLSRAQLYHPAATAATYERLGALATEVAGAGLPAIVDATFLKHAQRDPFRRLAGELGVPFFILDIRAGVAVLRARLLERARRGGDPSDADAEVLARQLEQDEAWSAAEQAHVLSIDNEAGLDQDALRRACAPLLAACQAR